MGNGITLFIMPGRQDEGGTSIGGKWEKIWIPL